MLQNQQFLSPAKKISSPKVNSGLMGAYMSELNLDNWSEERMFGLGIEGQNMHTGQFSSINNSNLFANQMNGLNGHPWEGNESQLGLELQPSTQKGNLNHLLGNHLNPQMISQQKSHQAQNNSCNQLKFPVSVEQQFQRLRPQFSSLQSYQFPSFGNIPSSSQIQAQNSIFQRKQGQVETQSNLAKQITNQRYLQNYNNKLDSNSTASLNGTSQLSNLLAANTDLLNTDVNLSLPNQQSPIFSRNLNINSSSSPVSSQKQSLTPKQIIAEYSFRAQHPQIQSQNTLSQIESRLQPKVTSDPSLLTFVIEDSNTNIPTQPITRQNEVKTNVTSVIGLAGINHISIPSEWSEKGLNLTKDADKINQYENSKQSRFGIYSPFKRDHKDSMGGFKVSDLETWVNIAPEQLTREEFGSVDLHHVSMSLRSELEFEVTHALNTITVLSTDQNHTLSLVKCPELVNSLVTLGSGCISILIEAQSLRNDCSLTQTNKGLENEAVRKRNLEDDEMSHFLSKFLRTENSDKFPVNVEMEHYEKNAEDEKEMLETSRCSVSAQIKSNVDLSWMESRDHDLHSSLYTYGPLNVTSRSRDIGRRISDLALCISTIFRNLSFTSENQDFLATHRGYIQFLLDCMRISELSSDSSIEFDNFDYEFYKMLVSEILSSKILEKRKTMNLRRGDAKNSGISETRWPLFEDLTFDQFGLEIPKITNIVSRFFNQISSRDEDLRLDQINFFENMPEEVILSLLFTPISALDHRKNSLVVLSNINLNLPSDEAAQLVFDVLSDFLSLPHMFTPSTPETVNLSAEEISNATCALETIAKITVLDSNRNLIPKLNRLELLIDRLVSLFPITSITSISNDDLRGHITTPLLELKEASESTIILWTLAILNIYKLSSIDDCNLRELIATRAAVIPFLLQLSRHALFKSVYNSRFDEQIATISVHAMATLNELAKTPKNHAALMYYEPVLLELLKSCVSSNSQIVTQFYAKIVELNKIMKEYHDALSFLRNPQLKNISIKRQLEGKIKQLSEYSKVLQSQVLTLQNAIKQDNTRLEELDIENLAASLLFCLITDQ
ncbi:hypothetical protein HK096_005478 [Nowakowskiella sp. JEL0078]|nr:hypothetical protein HK096_005478 [Nowakowskiella sp. JEL0078]